MSESSEARLGGQEVNSSEFDVIFSANALKATLDKLAISADINNDYQHAREALKHSGLLALRVPKFAGGYGGSQAQAIAVSRIIAQADAGVAQLLQPHYGFTDIIAFLPSEKAREILYQDILKGERIANAASERDGKHAADFSTTLSYEGDHYRLHGRKYYATGSLGARWITVLAKAEHGGHALAFIRIDAPGVTLLDDWNGLGQRGSSSGSLILENVKVAADYIIPVWDTHHRNIAWPESGRLIHAAIDVGIAEGIAALGAKTVATDQRIPFESSHSSLAEDPVLQYQIGVLSARILAVKALLENTALLLDDIQINDSAPDKSAQLTLLHAQLSSTKALAAEISLTASSDVFSWTGARAADRNLFLDRYWRNARTHTLHDPVRLRYQELGRSQIAQFQESQP